MRIDIGPLLREVNQGFKDLERQTVTVGVLDANKNSARGQYNGDFTQKTISDPDGGTFTYENRKPKKGSRAKNPKLAQVAAWVDKRRNGQMFEKFKIKAAHNADVARVAEAFAAMYFQEGDTKHVRRLENACRALVRNPILRSKYGSNKPATIAEKGFNHWAVDTGTLFRNIKAKYRRVP